MKEQHLPELGKLQIEVIRKIKLFLKRKKIMKRKETFLSVFSFVLLHVTLLIFWNSPSLATE